MMTLTQRETAFIIAVIRRAVYPKINIRTCDEDCRTWLPWLTFFLLDDVNASWDVVELIAPEH